jgi:hypothetical protein
MLVPTLAALCFAQTNQQATPEPTPQLSIVQKQIVELPLPKRGSYRPRLTLENALTIADRYIAKEKIDISHFYLLEAKYILYGDKDTKDPSWYFWWVHEDGASGHYVELVVSIKTGNVRRLMSM